MEYDPKRYGSSFADVYDSWYRSHDPNELVAFVRSRTKPDARVLELGVGTGRVALALSRIGLNVWGIDTSEEMLAVAEKKPGAERLTLSQGDVGDPNAFPVQEFDVVLACFNLLFNLEDAVAQQRSLRACCEAIGPDGILILETFVPAPPPERRTDLVTKAVTSDGVILISTDTDPSTQVISGCHIEINEAGQRLRPWRVRYAFPEQLDTLAAAAGLERIEVYSDFAETGFDPDASSNRVAVYRRQ